jgi:hypothetical protein
MHEICKVFTTDICNKLDEEEVPKWKGEHIYNNVVKECTPPLLILTPLWNK